MSNAYGGDFNRKIDYVFKVVLIGDSAVGKSQLLARFVKNEFSVDSKATIGVEFQTKTLLIDQKMVKAQIWDTAGQERYRAVISAYYRGAVGVMLLYDMTNRQSFDRTTRWLEEARQHVRKDTVIMLIGNKCDFTSLREVPVKDAQEFAERENLCFMETSAAEATNVENTFLTALMEIYRIASRKPVISAEKEYGDVKYIKTDYVFKVVLIGDSTVGKSQLLARFAKNEFDVRSKATIGFESQSKTVPVDQEMIMAHIWDIGGQERYHAVTKAYYKGAVGALLVYDITKRRSFDHMTRRLEELRRHADKDIVIMLIGNKCDLASSRAVPVEDAQEFAKRENLCFMETSALEGTYVISAFLTALTKIYRIISKK
ncbi:hypothetical protein OSB04_001371 [Centaurea solstitialis]|uniref:Uncharacterized protein n=1 Tax=Centaurea solstitialis TaxID=347529 RepID=A0AA38U2K5_9ASTR|nr:hypothetical protein OSB04_001371 [Centaurea solstitialis]